MGQHQSQTGIERGLLGMLSPAEVAEYIGVPLSTVRNWKRTGTGPPYHKIAGLIKYRLSDVDDWIAGRRAPGDIA